MNKEEIDIDRHYDEVFSKYQEEERVPFSAYRELEEKFEKLEGQVKDIIKFIQDNDPAGAYEYAVGEGLV